MNGLLIPLLAPLGPLALVLLMALAFAETGLLAGFFLPADTVLVSAGILAAAGALPIPLWLSLVALALAAAAGNEVAYRVGRRLGPRLEAGRTTRFVTPPRLALARSYFDRHGSKAVVLSRFVPLVRTLTPVLAGIAGMDRRRFTVVNLLGAAAWSLVMFGGGFWLGAVPFVAGHLELLLVAVLVLSLVPSAGALIRARVGRRSNPDASTCSSTLPRACSVST